MKPYDLLIVGAGLFGAVVAQQAQAGQCGPGQRRGQHRAHKIVLAFQTGPGRAQAGPSGGDQPLPQQ